MIPTSMVFGRELRLPSDLLFEAPPDKKQSTTDYVVELVDWPHDIHYYTCQHLKVASDRIRPAMTTWPILQDSRKGTKSGCTV
jgi:hypothetical protein